MGDHLHKVVFILCVVFEIYSSITRYSFSLLMISIS